MIEIQVKNQDIESILNGNSVIKFCTKNRISERMRIKFFCDGICGKTYVEGCINQIFLRQKTVDEKTEFTCQILASLILF